MKIKPNQYTKKWILLIALTVFGLIISYYLAFSKTIALYHEIQFKKEIAEKVNNKPIEISKLEEKIKKNTEILNKKTGLDSLTSRQKMLDMFAVAANQFKFAVKEVSPSYYSKEDSLHAEVSSFTLEGNYFDLVKTWNFIENNISFGSVKSAKFIVNEDFRINKKKLNLILYVELLKNKKE